MQLYSDQVLPAMNSDCLSVREGRRYDFCTFCCCLFVLYRIFLFLFVNNCNLVNFNSLTLQILDSTLEITGCLSCFISYFLQINPAPESGCFVSVIDGKVAGPLSTAAVHSV